MTKSEYKYLSEIYENGRLDGKVCVARIAERVGVSDVSVYKAMDKLRKKGYIAADGKYALVTPQGKSILSEYERLIAYVTKQLTDKYGLTVNEAKEDARGVICALSEKSRKAIMRMIP